MFPGILSLARLRADFEDLSDAKFAPIENRKMTAAVVDLKIRECYTGRGGG